MSAAPTVALASPELADAPLEGRFADLRRRVQQRLALRFARVPFAMRNAGPIATITFDDAPESALAVGARMMEDSGARGTFYIASGLLGQRARHWRILAEDGVRALHDAGHEIACHTFSHRRVPDLGAAALAEEIARDEARLRAIVPGSALANFAYPYGQASVSAKRRLAGRFATSRGIVPEVNAGLIDLQLVAALPLTDAATDPAAIDRVLDATVRLNGWAVFYTHDVAAAPSPFGCTPALLAHAIAAVRRRGIALETVARAVELIGRG